MNPEIRASNPTRSGQASLSSVTGIWFGLTAFKWSHSVAKGFRAACTPEFFLFDARRKLVYRGQLDETRPGGVQAHGRALRAALDATLNGKPIDPNQTPSVGCNIKWKRSNAPEYF